MSHAKVFEHLTDIRNEFGKAHPAQPDKGWLEGKVAELKGWIAKIERPPPSGAEQQALANQANQQAVLSGASAVNQTVGLATERRSGVRRPPAPAHRLRVWRRPQRRLRPSGLPPSCGD
jgi:hypothetical protein